MLAVALSVGSALLLDPEPGTAVLGGMLALTLSRSQLERDWRGRLEAAVALPLIGVVAALVGFLLLEAPVAGAAAYTLALAASVFVRRFGAAWRRTGGLLAIPFTALLVAPPTIVTSGPLASAGWLVPILVPLVAFVWVTLVQLGARAVGLPMSVTERGSEATETTGSNASPAADSSRSARSATVAGRRDKHGWLPSDKMALQLAIALAVAFLVGLLLFARWEWLVLTVVVVLFGNRGRNDALVKGIGRFAGAAVGALVGFLVLGLSTSPGFAWQPQPWWLAVTVVALALGIFGRRFAYIVWAFGFTVALTLLQWIAEGAAPVGPALIPAPVQRLAEILVGSAISVAVAWFVLPVARRRPLPRTRAEWLRAFRAD